MPEHVEGLIVCAENDREKVRCLPSLHSREPLTLQRVSVAARSPQVIALGPLFLSATEDHVAGYGYLCPVEDIDHEDLLPALRSAALEMDRVNTADWLVGRTVEQRENWRNKSESPIEIQCFETDPFPDAMPTDGSQADSPRSRNFMYRAAAFEIASFVVPAVRGRMILPECVRTDIEARYGCSRTGFSSTPVDA